MLSHASSDDTALTRGSGARRLEIVAGPRAGARIRIEAGHALRIGCAFDDDVVIRHPSVQGVRALLSRDAQGVRLQVESGTVVLLGIPVEAGRTIRLPQGVPFAIGESLLAVGPDTGGGWASCRRLARQLLADRVDPSSMERVRDPQVGLASTDAPREASRSGSSRWWRVPVLLLVPGIVALAALLSFRAPPGAGPVADPLATQALRTVLADEGLSHLKIQVTTSGGMALQGMVDRDADRARLAERLVQAGVAARLDLGTGEQLARQVGDVLRLNGVAAQVRHIGRGVVEARFVDPGSTRREQVESAVRRDVPGLGGLVVETSAAPDVVAKPPRTALDAGKRVMNVVYGPRGYVVTADGTRYFEGAFLPSGDRITRISSDEVHLERDGKTSRLAI